MARPKLSITLISHDSHDLLRECLRSLYECRKEVEFEVLVVDNVSKDGSGEMVRREFPEVHLIVNERRAGFGANQNKAMRQCRGDYFLLLNEDTVVKPAALTRMCAWLDADPMAGVVGCRLENIDGTLQPSCYRFPSPARALAENLLLVAAFPDHPWWGDYRAWPHDRNRYVDFVSGAAFMVRREVVDATGGFDERFFMYAEETDWCYRIARAGWKVAFVHDAAVVHRGGQSTLSFKHRQFCEFNRSSCKYILKHYGSAGLAIQYMVMVLGSALRLLAWSGAYLVTRSRRRAAIERLGFWRRQLRWWLGLGPNEGIAELAEAQTAGAGVQTI